MKNLILLIFVFVFIKETKAQVMFQKTYGGDGGEDIYTAKQTSSGGYIIAGNTSNYGIGSSGAYLIKTNSVGDTMWTKAFVELGLGRLGFSLSTTYDNGFIMGGMYDTPAVGNFAFMLNVDSSGNYQWSKAYGGPSGNEFAYSVQQSGTDC